MRLAELEDKIKIIDKELTNNKFKWDYISYIDCVSDKYIEFKWTQRKPTKLGYFRLIDVLTMNNVFITKTNYANLSVVGRIYIEDLM